MIETLQSIADATKTEVEKLMQIAESKHKQNDYEGALAALDRVKNLDPNFTTAWFYSSLIYYRLEDYERALIECNLAIEGNALNPLDYVHLGYIYQKIPNRQDKTIQSWKKAAELFLNRGDTNNYQKMIQSIDLAMMIPTHLGCCHL